MPRTPTTRFLRVIAAALCLAEATGGCASGSGGTSTGGAATGSTGTSSGNGLMPDGNSGTGAASGVAGEFGAVADSRWIGAPDDPQNTRVIYLFDKLVSCSWLSQQNWNVPRLDWPFPDAIHVIELKLFGTAAGEYPVGVTFTPAVGEARVSYMSIANLGSQGWPAMMPGSVTLDRFVDGASADGTFSARLDMSGSASDAPFSGGFHATYCATGRQASGR